MCNEPIRRFLVVVARVLRDLPGLQGAVLGLNEPVAQLAHG